jgi:hypothetical protein
MLGTRWLQVYVGARPPPDILPRSGALPPGLARHARGVLTELTSLSGKARGYLRTDEALQPGDAGFAPSAPPTVRALAAAAAAARGRGGLGLRVRPGRG